MDLFLDISCALAAHGLIARGGFNFDIDGSPPAGVSGSPAKSVMLVGQAGASAWPHFTGWRTTQPQDLNNPLDAWTREIIETIAARCEARAVFPSDKPYLPFQQWAMRAEGLRASPLGILMHPEYGLWHAYRGALLFDEEIDFPKAEKPIHPCDTCVEKPCLKSCPVGAYSETGFAYDSCLTHVRSEAGASCRDGGCHDRNACPHGAAYRYGPDQQAFHMASFAR